MGDQILCLQHPAGPNFSRRFVFFVEMTYFERYHLIFFVKSIAIV